MYKTLCDLVRYTHQLDFQGFKLIIDKDGHTEVASRTKNGDAILEATLKQNLPIFARPDMERKNSIGFTNLEILSAYLRSSVMDDNTIIEPECTKDEDGQYVRALKFTSTGGHVCTYKTLLPEIAKKQIRTFRRVVDDLTPVFTINISNTTFNEFRQLGSVLTKFEPSFTFKTKKGKLYAVLGMTENQAEIPLCDCDVDVDPNIKFNYNMITAIMKQAPQIENVSITLFKETNELLLKFDTDIANYSFSVVCMD